MYDEIGSDWVPVKDVVFKEEKIVTKLIFSVAWNVEHSKVRPLITALISWHWSTRTFQDLVVYTVIAVYI